MPNNTETLIIADEYAQLKYTGGDQVFATARKFNVRLWVCLQDYAQLQEIHPKTCETFINNAGVVQWMSATDLAGSEYLSRMCGETEIHSVSRSVSYPFPERRSFFGSSDRVQVSDSVGQGSRSLKLPQEIRALTADEQILFITGVPKPIFAKRVPYYKTSLRRRARPNPYYQPKGFIRNIFGG